MFNARKPQLQKCLVYFKIQSVDNPWEIVVAVNPQEYYEHFEDFRCNKNHKGIQKRAPGMNFENFAKRIVSVNEIENFENAKNEHQEQQRFSVVGAKKEKTSIMKTKFSQTNDKIFYLPN